MFRARFSPITARPIRPMSHFWVMVDSGLSLGFRSLWAAFRSKGEPIKPDDAAQYLTFFDMIGPLRLSSSSNSDQRFS